MLDCVAAQHGPPILAHTNPCHIPPVHACAVLCTGMCQQHVRMQDSRPSAPWPTNTRHTTSCDWSQATWIICCSMYTHSHLHSHLHKHMLTWRLHTMQLCHQTSVCCGRLDCSTTTLTCTPLHAHDCCAHCSQHTLVHYQAVELEHGDCFVGHCTLFGKPGPVLRAR